MYLKLSLLNRVLNSIQGVTNYSCFLCKLSFVSFLAMSLSVYSRLYEFENPLNQFRFFCIFYNGDSINVAMNGNATMLYWIILRHDMVLKNYMLHLRSNGEIAVLLVIQSYFLISILCVHSLILQSVIWNMSSQLF